MEVTSFVKGQRIQWFVVAKWSPQVMRRVENDKRKKKKKTVSVPIEWKPREKPKNRRINAVAND